LTKGEPGVYKLSMRIGDFIALSEHLLVYKDERSVGVLKQAGRSLIIDIAEGKVLDFLPRYNVEKVDGILATHHHRDQVQGAYRILAKGAWIGAPEAERALFEDVKSYWQDPGKRWHLYSFSPNYLLSEPLPVHKGFKDGETFSWGPARITAVSTPGHTKGSMSYLVEVDGRRFAFCGDLIYDKGKIKEIYSLQKGMGELSDYHGFMFAWRDVVSSLRKLSEMGAEILIPSQGNIIYQPEEASELLEERLERCYEIYLSTSALWYYFPQILSQQTSQHPLVAVPSQLPPPFLHHIGTSWILVNGRGNAFVMDCGNEEIIREVEKRLASGEIKKVEALWVTHTHDDHTDAAAQFSQRFGCEVIAEESVANVVSHPSAWKLPCLSPNPVSVDRMVKHGESWQWDEFILTAYHFPGQSLYHSGLLVEGKGLRLFFLGDSLTPTGLDDYCPYNRNFLGENRGYDFCLDLLMELQPDLLFNSHIERPFALTQTHLRTWRESLKERKRRLRELLPWDDPNYGIDPYWTFCFPYEQKVLNGRNVEVEVVITNHLSHSVPCGARILPPLSWGIPQRSSLYVRDEAKPKKETRLHFSFPISPCIPSGRYVVLVNVEYNGKLFPSLGEFIVELSEG